MRYQRSSQNTRSKYNQTTQTRRQIIKFPGKCIRYRVTCLIPALGGTGDTRGNRNDILVMLRALDAGILLLLRPERP